MKRLCAVTAFVLLASQSLAGADIQPKPGTVQKYVYVKTPQGELAIHVHFPADWAEKDQRPAVVFFFGGGWSQGSVTQFEKQAEYLAGRGLVAARADYRVKSRHNTTPDKCVEDAKAAVRWLRQNAGSLGIDPKRIAAGGGSAGGHIAAAGTICPGLEAEGQDLSVSAKANLLVLFNPVLNTTGRAAKIGSEEIAKKISPNDHLAKDAPPAVIFFGTSDALLETGQEYLAKAKALGLAAELHTADGQAHGFFNKAPWTERTLFHLDEFLAKHGWTKGPPTIKPADSAVLKLADKSPK